MVTRTPTGGGSRLKEGADRLDDPLGFFRIAHPDGLYACFLRGLVVAAGEDRVADKDHADYSYAESLSELLAPVGLVDARSCDVDRGGTAQSNREARNHWTEDALDRLALGEIGMPFLLVGQRSLLAEGRNVIWLSRSSFRSPHCCPALKPD